jgi:hypothetical protein
MSRLRSGEKRRPLLSLVKEGVMKLTHQPIDSVQNVALISIRTALEVQKENETTDQIMNKLFENKKFRNAVEQALRVLK